jgi:hypothetical protein
MKNKQQSEQLIKDQSEEGVDGPRRAVLRIGTDVVNRYPDAAVQALAGCLIYRAECLFLDRVFEYHACGPAFPVVMRGCRPPVFVAQFEFFTDETGPEDVEGLRFVEWRPLDAPEL